MKIIQEKTKRTRGRKKKQELAGNYTNIEQIVYSYMAYNRINTLVEMANILEISVQALSLAIRENECGSFLNNIFQKLIKELDGDFVDVGVVYDEPVEKIVDDFIAFKGFKSYGDVADYLGIAYPTLIKSKNISINSPIIAYKIASLHKEVNFFE